MPDDVTPVVRIDPLAPPSTTPNPPLSGPAAGAVIPPAVAPYLAVVVIAAGSVVPFLTVGSVPFIVCSVVASVGAALGILSPGWRRT